MPRLAVRDQYYKALSIFVLDPLEYVAMGLNILKGMNGEARWEAMHKEKWKHPDAQKIACVAHGALIYTAMWPERTHKDMRPPLDWKLDAGITDANMWEAKQQLISEDPSWEAKQKVRQEINEAMDGNT